jgi:hypothetical protein
VAVPNGSLRNNAKTRGNHPSVSKQDDGHPLSRFVPDQCKKQFVERLRVPETSEPDRRALSDLARQATELARDRYRLHETVRHRILADLGTGPVTLNQKLTAWWDLDLGSFRAEVKKALKTSIPVAERSEWERETADRSSPAHPPCSAGWLGQRLPTALRVDYFLRVP